MKQILCYDTDDVFKNRLFNLSGLDRNILLKLQDMIHQKGSLNNFIHIHIIIILNKTFGKPN